ncbi:MAG TPA: hypothetical protein VF144_02635, partial [Chitinophagaceae bacterium]
MKEMKNNFIHIDLKKLPDKVVLISLMTIAFIFFNEKNAIAQDTKDSGTSKLPFTMNLSSIVSNGNRTVKILATRKENKKTVIADDIRSPFNLYLNEVKDYDPA